MLYFIPGTSLSVIINLNVNTAILLSTSVAVIYTMFGQIVSVAYTDILQLVLVFFGLVCLITFINTSQQTQNICMTFIQCWANVEDVGPTLYKCYTNVLCLLGWHLRPLDVRNVVCTPNGNIRYIKHKYNTARLTPKHCLNL